MAITQKCQYALRAIYELARRQQEGPCKIGAVAEAQNIPVRFLENILSSLKSAGVVDSARGKDGGYFLAKPANAITVGEVIRFIQGRWARWSAERAWRTTARFMRTASSGRSGTRQGRPLRSSMTVRPFRTLSISQTIAATGPTAGAARELKIKLYEVNRHGTTRSIS